MLETCCFTLFFLGFFSERENYIFEKIGCCAKHMIEHAKNMLAVGRLNISYDVDVLGVGYLL